MTTNSHEDRQAALPATSPADYSDLRALYVNCTLKRSPDVARREPPWRREGPPETSDRPARDSAPGVTCRPAPLGRRVGDEAFDDALPEAIAFDDVEVELFDDVGGAAGRRVMWSPSMRTETFSMAFWSR